VNYISISEKLNAPNPLILQRFANRLNSHNYKDIMREQLKRFIDAMEPNSIAIIPAAHEATRSYDTEYRFRQDSDFWYLTGFPEPDAVAVIDSSNKKGVYMLYVRPRDLEMETWFGRREGVEGAVKNYGADHAFPVDKFAADLPKLLDGHENLYYRFAVDKTLDQQILHYLSNQRQRRLKTAYPPHTIIDPTIILGEMRLHKTDDEIEMMQKAATISAEAHILAMKKTKPGMNEFQVESLIESFMRDRGASGVAYNSIVGGGENATILHYVENNRPLKDGDLILVDAGAEYKGYAADITRTFPINGRFSQAQREVYDVVLDVQQNCTEFTKTGNTVKKRQELSVELLTEGMKKLGLLKGKTSDLIKKKAYMKYYMHGVGHYLGLDVHDAGRYFTDQAAKSSRPFAPGMVLTVEPGLYIPPDDRSAPPKYRGIGVRIEDDVLVTEEGNRNLTAKVPKDPDEIEAIMNSGKSRAAAK
jgi:Xaa-Pro aminopeptidase